MKTIIGLLLGAVLLAAQTPIPGSGGGGGSSSPTSPGGSSGQTQYNNGGSFGGYTMSGTCTITASTGVITCSRVLVFAIGSVGGAALTTSSVSNALGIPVGCTIGNPSGTSYSITLGTGDSGTATVKFWKIATGGTAIPTSANVINTAGLSISTGTLYQNSTFTDFSPATIVAGDTMMMAVTAITGTIASITVTLPCQ